jgi:hypothetical protein
MRTIFFLLAAGVLGWAVWLLFNRVQRFRGELAADARAREMLETWDERRREAERLDAPSMSGKGHHARR